MPAPLVPARLAFAADGTPWSEAYGDVYHSADGGPAQARHVFLAGNGLPERWRGRRRFTVLETGFGFGLSFLATWQAWREDPARCERLHFVSIEKHPFAAADLSVVLQKYAGLQGEALVSRWPMLVPGMHRLEFENGRVVLTLFFGDVAEGLPQLALAADAIYLDGFAPGRNPEMWAPQLLRHLGRLATRGATAATWSVAAPVRAALEGAGFVVTKEKGFAAKREMLRASLIPRKALSDEPPSLRSAIVVGAGIAGAAVCDRLAGRGWDVTLIERQSAPPAGPGRHAGVFHPVITRDDSLFARLTRACFVFLLNYLKDIPGLQWDRCGVLQLARDEAEQAAQRAALQSLALPPEYAQHAPRAAAGGLAGLPVAADGVWYPQGGWIRPLSLVAAQLARAGGTGRLQVRYGCEVARIAREGGLWSAYDAAGGALARAPVLVLANAADALTLAPSRAIRMRRVRGQISFLPASRFAAPRAVVLRGGFVLPALGGESIAGASYDFDDPDAAPRSDSHAGNLERLERILPGAGAQLDPASLEGLVGFRAVAPDRLPLIGALADEAAPMPAGAQPITLPRAGGLYGAFGYGSRGLLWAGLGAELLASLLEGEPLPVERRLVDALDPGRFLLRALRRGAGAARPGATAARA